MGTNAPKNLSGVVIMTPVYDVCSIYVTENNDGKLETYLYEKDAQMALSAHNDCCIKTRMISIFYADDEMMYDLTSRVRARYVDADETRQKALTKLTDEERIALGL
jgi:hypothetical protein